MGKLEKRILEELMFERIVAAIDLGELLSAEADLARSIDRALARLERPPEDRPRLAKRYLDRAWLRAGREALGHLSAADVPAPGGGEHRCDEAAEPRPREAPGQAW
jgi:hypothetical protein